MLYLLSKLELVIIRKAALPKCHISPTVATRASYKQLAYIGHLIGMDSEERSRWYEVARYVPLSRSHAAHVIEELEAGKQLVGEIEKEMCSAFDVH